MSWIPTLLAWMTQISSQCRCSCLRIYLPCVSSFFFCFLSVHSTSITALSVAIHISHRHHACEYIQPAPLWVDERILRAENHSHHPRRWDLCQHRLLCGRLIHVAAFGYSADPPQIVDLKQDEHIKQEHIKQEHTKQEPSTPPAATHKARTRESDDESSGPRKRNNFDVRNPAPPPTLTAPAGLTAHAGGSVPSCITCHHHVGHKAVAEWKAGEVECAVFRYSSDMCRTEERSRERGVHGRWPTCCSA